jgi:transcriptional regulator with XRE-family HTH domain
MERRGWTQKELALRSRIGDGGISRLLNRSGQRPTANQIAGLGLAFGLTPTEVMEAIGYWPPEADPPGAA